jgi:hypothetical protein
MIAVDSQPRRIYRVHDNPAAPRAGVGRASQRVSADTCSFASAAAASVLSGQDIRLDGTPFSS